MSLEKQAEEAAEVVRQKFDLAGDALHYKFVAEAASKVYEPVLADAELALRVYSGRQDMWGLSKEQQAAITRALRRLDAEAT